MKKMRKAAAMLMAATVAAAMPMTAMAASITVEDAYSNETYKAYKIFDYISDADLDADEKTTENSKVAYTMSSNSDWKSTVEAYTYGGKKVFTLTPSKNKPSVLVVQINSDITMDQTVAGDFAAHLSERLADKKKPAIKEDATAENGAFNGLDTGYYFVNTTTGSLCSLVNTDSNQTLKEKNSLPHVEKTADKATASIGDEVTYTITVTDGKGTETPIVIHDIAEAGLEVDTSTIAVKKIIGTTSSDIESGDDTYALKETKVHEACTFEVELKTKLVTDLKPDEKVVITYKAKLGAATEIAPETNDNTVYLSYFDHDKIEGNTVRVLAYQFDVVKTDMDYKGLTGAKFKLFRSLNGADEIKVIKESEGVYRVAATEDEEKKAVEIEAGKATIKGLGGSADYYLEETHAPEGYNALTERFPVHIINDNLVAATPVDNVYGDGGVRVQNNHGALLPSTGGIGTTVFYAAGIVVMAGAVFFVVRNRKHD